jgi:hypothetical protein
VSNAERLQQSCWLQSKLHSAPANPATPLHRVPFARQERL